MSRRRSSVVLLLATLVAGLAVVSPLAGASQGDAAQQGAPLPPASAPTFRLLEPTEDTILTGLVTFRIGMTGATLQTLVFQVDGVEICRRTEPPFECTWDAGSKLGQREVRAVAMTATGQRLVAAVRTKGVLVSDRSEVDAILVSAHVTDGNGRFVPGLKAGDFRLLEEGIPQQITLLDAGDGGAEVLLALDVSGSMAPNIEDLQMVALDFLDRLRPIDKVTVAGFNSAFFVIAGRDSDRATRRRAIADLNASGGTAIYDTLVSAAELVGQQPGRRAIVVFSDGDDVSSRSTLETAREALHARDTLMYLVATGKADADSQLRRSLSQLALETGGNAYFGNRLSALAPHFREIVDDIAQQYLLSFSPDKPLGDGKWRRLTVEMKNKALRVRARSGYFATRR
jgi:VWFA-related protein